MTDDVGVCMRFGYGNTAKSVEFSDTLIPEMNRKKNLKGAENDRFRTTVSGRT